MFRFVFSFLLVMSSVFPVVSVGETMDSFSCLLAMHEKRVSHDSENSCRVAIVEEQDLMVYLIGQEYIKLGEFGAARKFYSSYLNSGYHDGAVLGLWTLERFIYGNVTNHDPDVKRDHVVRNILRESAYRGDQMAQYVLKGYKSSNLTRIKTMSDEGGNIYATIHYIFFSSGNIKDKKSYIDAVYKAKLPMGRVLLSTYEAVTRKKDSEQEALSRAYEMARSALADGSNCAYLPLSIFYQQGKSVEKDVKEAAKLFSLVKKNCWYAEKNSDMAWR
jgi:hypothetical protein